MDPFDEFEFKPLTEGLGFHKKPASLKDQVRSAGLMDEHLQSLPASIPLSGEDLAAPKKQLTFDDVISSLEKGPLKSPMQGKSFLEVTEPLPRPRADMSALQSVEVELPRPAPVQSPFPTPETLRQPTGAKKTPSQKEMASAGTRRGAADSPQGQLVPLSASLPSALLDSVIVIALNLIFLAALLSVMKVDLGVVMNGMESDGWTLLSVISMIMAVAFIYLVIARSFYGRTLGEWTFDVQLGRNEDHRQAMYPVKVVARSLLVGFTGLALLPLLSLMIGRDVAGRICGVQLYQQRA